jgi:hypothetical protein
VKWLTVGTVWAMDDCEYDGSDDQGRKLYWNQTQDMASRYRLAPMAGEFPCGEEIAAYLEAMFDRYGAPLFFKRDNRGNLNHVAVNEVLSRYMVLPLNSPTYYAPYNGAIENAQGQLKRAVRARLRGPCPREHFEAYAEAATHDVNHQTREVLGGRTACRVFFDEPRPATFTKMERRNAYEWISTLANDILTCRNGSKAVSSASAWRIAAEAWLAKNGHIKVSMNRKVSPYLSRFWSH